PSRNARYSRSVEIPHSRIRLAMRADTSVCLFSRIAMPASSYARRRSASNTEWDMLAPGFMGRGPGGSESGEIGIVVERDQGLGARVPVGRWELPVRALSARRRHGAAGTRRAVLRLLRGALIARELE